MKIIRVPPQHGDALNIRQLFNPIFFEPARRHPDMKRQRSRRQKAKDLAKARELKARYVPLCEMPPVAVYNTLCRYDFRRTR
jgi:hypothetical protein